MQSKTHSHIESWTNLIGGGIINILAGYIIYPAFGYTFILVELTGITICFMCLSYVRLYFVRRFFNMVGSGEGE
jgi:hypothetical protein